MEWMLMPYYRYAEFFGRSRRKEFWLWTLFTVVVGIVIDAIFGRSMVNHTAWGLYYGVGFGGVGGVVRGLFNLVNFVPALAVSVRRLHDIDRSGWWLLLLFLPILGWFVLLVFYCLDGTAGTNRYGVDPKDRGTVDVFR